MHSFHVADTEGPLLVVVLSFGPTMEMGITVRRAHGVFSSDVSL